MQKYLIILLFITTLVSLVVSSSITPILGIITLLLSLTLSTYAIIQKYAGTEHARAKILKEVGVMVLTLVIVLFLGGIASMLANYQVGMRWGRWRDSCPRLRRALWWDTLSAWGWGGL
ncbi:MAG: hypothetical protein IPJ47_16375 [Anaerolineales bacterium]|nr:hypothetical protein [Anaerolineales bacterium]